MDCWIGVVTENDRRVVRLAGRLSVAQVPELLTVCADSRILELDLTDLMAVDVAGIEALQRYAPKVPPCSERPATSSSRSTRPAADRSPRTGRIPGADPASSGPR